MHFADAPGSSRRPSSPPTLPLEVRYYLLLDLNDTLCDRVRAPCASKIEQNVVVFLEGVEDFLRYCWQHFEVYFWSCCQKKKMVKIMSKVEAETGRFVPSDRLLSHEECTVSKYRDPKNSQKPFFFKDLSIFYRRVPLANNNNTLLIDDSPLNSLLNDQYNAVFLPTFRDNDGQADDFLVCRLLPYLDRLRLSRL